MPDARAAIFQRHRCSGGRRPNVIQGACDGSEGQGALDEAGFSCSFADAAAQRLAKKDSERCRSMGKARRERLPGPGGRWSIGLEGHRVTVACPLLNRCCANGFNGTGGAAAVIALHLVRGRSGVDAKEPGPKTELNACLLKGAGKPVFSCPLRSRRPKHEKQSG